MLDGRGWESRGRVHAMKPEKAADVQIHQTYGEGSTDIHQELQDIHQELQGN